MWERNKDATGNFKKEVVWFPASEGITQKFIAKKVDIKPPILSKFKNGLVELDIFGVEALDNFLTSKGY